MYIRHLTVKNWLIHKNTSVDLFPVAVFVGPNNGGKSALFDALLNFSMVSRGRLSQAFGPGPYSFGACRHRGAAKPGRIGYEVELAESDVAPDSLKYRITYAAQQRGKSEESPRYIIYDEHLSATDKVLFDRSTEECKITDVAKFVDDETSIWAAIRHAQTQRKYKDDVSLVTHCAKGISRINKFRLDPLTLARPCRLPDAVPGGTREAQIPRLGYNGDGLAGTLYFLAETSNPMLDTVVAGVGGVIDGFQGFEFNTVGTDRIGFSARFDDSRSIINAANLSDGTLTLIGLLVLLAMPDRPPILCLEEPENGLTPRATRAIYDAVVKATSASGSDKPSQVLMSSHSPFVICEAWHGEERDFIYQVKPEDGKALVRPFADVIAEHGIQLGKDQDGERNHLSLNVADKVMAGYYS